MNPVIDKILKEDINSTPYYRIIYRLVESDKYLKKVCDFICDVFEGKIQKPGLSTFSYNLEFLFSPFQILIVKKDKEVIDLEALANFLWKLSDNKICFVRDDTLTAKNKYTAVNLKEFSPKSMRLNYYFVSAVKSNGTFNVENINSPESVLTPKETAELLDIIRKYALQEYKFKKPSK